MKKSNAFVDISALLLMSTTYITACGGGESSPGGAQGGTSAVGGQSSTGGSGATDGVSAAMSLNFLGGGTNCPFAVGYNDFPEVSGGHPVTASGATVTTPDNVTSSRGVVRVQCTIGASLLHGGISLGGNESMGLVTSRSGNYANNLTYWPANSSVSYGGTADSPCTVTAISTTATGGLYSVSCPTLAGDDGSICVLGTSYVYFEGCTLQ
jgi:hypothetical protein